jgi:hypothetical protein
MIDTTPSIGNIIRLFGWAVVAYNAVSYSFALVSTLADASVAAYAPLILMEGSIFIGGGLIIVWVGRFIRRRTEQPVKTSA